MPNDEVSILNVNDDIRDVEDEWLRQEISETGLMGHTVVDYEGTEYPFRSKMMIKNSVIFDDPVNNKTMINIKENIFIDKPQVIVGTYTYDGTEQGPEISGLTDDMIVQNATNINAGTYTLIIKLKDEVNSYWSDYTSAPIMYEYTINKAIVQIPEASGSYRYNMEEQSPEIQNLDETFVEVSGVSKATNAGSYTILFDLKDKVNTTWSDESTTVKSYNWIIQKGFTYISVDYTNPKTFNITNLYTDMTINFSSYSSPGAELNRIITVISDDTNIVTVEKIGELTYRITGNTNLDFGTTVVRINIEETDNYRSSDMTERFVIDMVPELNECSWSKISEISSTGMGSSCWSVGDRKEVILNGKIGDYLTLNNYKTYVFIIDFNNRSQSQYDINVINFGCFKSSLTEGYDVALIDSEYLSKNFVNGKICFNINHWKNSDGYCTAYGGWAASDIRYDILGSTDRPPSNYGSAKIIGATGQDPSSTCATNPKSNTLMAALPSDLRAVMVPLIKWSNNSDLDSQSPSATSTIDYLPLMERGEILNYQDNIGRNNHRINYYQTGNSFKKYYNNISVEYWLRSVYSNYGKDSDWFYVADDTYPSFFGSGDNPGISRGLSPIFAV